MNFISVPKRRIGVKSMTENLKELTMGSLVSMKALIEQEISRRKNEQRTLLINNFKEAFFALKEANILIDYYEDNYTDPALLRDWDGFQFN